MNNVEIKPSEEDYQNLEATSTKLTDRVLRWSHNLAAGRAEDEFKDGYFRTPEYERLVKGLRPSSGRLIVLTGTQGVGKSAALEHLYYKNQPPDDKKDLDILTTLLINWGNKNEQIKAVFNRNSEFFAFHPRLGRVIKLIRFMYREFLLADLKESRFVPIKPPEDKGVPEFLSQLDFDWAEKILGRGRCQALREKAWFRYLSFSHIILIDLPDYGRTDKRLLTRHLNEIYGLWIKLSNVEHPPNLVIAIQKECTGGHFFFGKMDKIELRPLSTDQLLASYETLFGSTHPFTETALLTLASRSRGNYRRFKRYVAIAIESWPQNPSLNPITDEHIRSVISIERVEEDLDSELEQIFPKNPDSRRDAVRIILHLSDSGPSEQGELAKALEIPDYTLSRLLSKLELHKYVARQSRGLQKIESLTEV